jgi:hypothetical protein
MLFSVFNDAVFVAIQKFMYSKNCKISLVVLFSGTLYS